MKKAERRILLYIFLLSSSFSQYTMQKPSPEDNLNIPLISKELREINPVAPEESPELIHVEETLKQLQKNTFSTVETLSREHTKPSLKALIAGSTIVASLSGPGQLTKHWPSLLDIFNEQKKSDQEVAE
jgi:hypothetical protein